MREAGDRIRVLLADDHVLVRAGIARVLERLAGVEVVAQASSGEEVLALLAVQRPDVVMTDIDMPGMDGIALTRALRERHPAVRVVVLTMFDEIGHVRRAVGQGAAAYLLKDAPATELELALRQVVAQGRYLSPDLARRLRATPPSVTGELTERQLQVLRLIAEGHTGREIGEVLGISARTVDMHRGQVMLRLGIADVAGLTRYALRTGLVEP